MTPISFGRLRTRVLFVVFFLSAAQGAYAAGSHEGEHDAGIGQPGNAAAATRTIRVSMFDNYFDPESISVQAGETVRFVVENQGAVLHEFNIGTAAMHVEHQAEMMTMFEHGMLEVDRINHDAMKMDMGTGAMAHDDPNSVLIAPGQSGEVVWTFPVAGRLEFACNVPGHYQVGMQGPVEITP